MKGQDLLVRQHQLVATFRRAISDTHQNWQANEQKFQIGNQEYQAQVNQSLARIEAKKKGYHTAAEKARKDLRRVNLDSLFTNIPNSEIHIEDKSPSEGFMVASEAVLQASANLQASVQSLRSERARKLRLRMTVIAIIGVAIVFVISFVVVSHLMVQAEERQMAMATATQVAAIATATQRAELASRTVYVNGRSTYSSSYYAIIDRVVFDIGYFDVYFESRGNSDLRTPETSCVIEKPSGQVIKLTDYSTPVRTSTNYRGYLRFPLDVIKVGSSYYFRYSCRSDYSDVFLFEGWDLSP